MGRPEVQMRMQIRRRMRQQKRRHIPLRLKQIPRCARDDNVNRSGGNSNGSGAMQRQWRLKQILRCAQDDSEKLKGEFRGNGYDKNNGNDHGSHPSKGGKDGPPATATATTQSAVNMQRRNATADATAVAITWGGGRASW
jgi:hypothetical protein